MNWNIRIAAALIVLVGSSRLIAATIYVDWQAVGVNNGSSWDDAYTSLQDALAHSGLQAGDRVFVAAGTYAPTTGSDRSIAFHWVPGVEVYGGFVGTESGASDRPKIDGSEPTTTLSGDIGSTSTDTDNSYHVVVMQGQTQGDTFHIDRFTIKDAYYTGGTW